MTDDITTPPPPYELHPTGAPPVGANLGTTPPPNPVATTPAPEDESTVGMGTSIALGCVAATIVLILIGLLVLFIANLLG